MRGVATEDEFCRRFAERVKLLVRSGRSPYGRDPDAYAADVAPIYWREVGSRGQSPEAVLTRTLHTGLPETYL